MLRRRILITLLVLSACLAIAVGGGYVWLRKSGRAKRDGRVTLHALREPVTVRFDRWGVPHVEARSVSMEGGTENGGDLTSLVLKRRPQPGARKARGQLARREEPHHGKSRRRSSTAVCARRAAARHHKREE